MQNTILWMLNKILLWYSDFQCVLCVFWEGPSLLEAVIDMLFEIHN